MTLQEALKAQMPNEDFKREYEALETEYKIINSFLDDKEKDNFSQKQFSESGHKSVAGWRKDSF